MALFGLFGKKSDAAAAQEVGGARAEQARSGARPLGGDPGAREREARPRRSRRCCRASRSTSIRASPTRTRRSSAFDGIVAVGEAAVAPVVAFLRKADSISWPLKMLDRHRSRRRRWSRSCSSCSRAWTPSTSATRSARSRSWPRSRSAATRGSRARSCASCRTPTRRVRFHAARRRAGAGEAAERSAGACSTLLLQRGERARAQPHPRRLRGAAAGTWAR